MRLRRYRPMALVLLVLHLGACTTWRPATVSPQQLIREEQPSSVRITLTSGETITVIDPIVRNDSIGGIPLSDVSTVEVRRPDPLGTFGLFALLTTLAIVAYEAATFCIWNCE